MCLVSNTLCLFVDRPFVVSTTAKGVAAVFVAGFGLAKGQDIGHVLACSLYILTKHNTPCRGAVIFLDPGGAGADNGFL